MTSLDKLAHELAWESAVSAIDCHSINVTDRRRVWLDIGPAKNARLLARDLHYLKLRGSLVKHPFRRFLVRIVEPKEITR